MRLPPSSRKQPFGPPRLARLSAAIDQPVMQTERTVAPELDLQRRDAEARPVRRTRHFRECVFRGVFRDLALEDETAFHRTRLRRGPGADLAVLRRAWRNRRRLPHRSPVPTEPRTRTCLRTALPVEAQRGMRLAQQLAALGAFEIGVEDEAARVGVLQQHHAHIRAAFGVDAGNRHRVRFIGLGFAGFFHPGVEQRHGIVAFAAMPPSSMGPPISLMTCRLPPSIWRRKAAHRYQTRETHPLAPREFAPYIVPGTATQEERAAGEHMRDPYDVLGVSKIRQRSRNQEGVPGTRQETPPRYPCGRCGRQEAFQEISAAYDIVGDKEKRGKFDRGEIDASGNPRGFDPRASQGFEGHPFAGGGGGGRGNRGISSSPGPTRGRRGAAEGFRAEDIFSDLLAGGRRTPPAQPAPQGRGFRPSPDRSASMRRSTGGTRRITLPDGREVDVRIPVGPEGRPADPPQGPGWARRQWRTGR